MRKKTRVSILTTGGTIEKSYDELEGTLYNKESLLNKYILKRLRLPFTEVSVTPIMAKDSLEMTDKDRDLIFRMVENRMTEGHPIIIVHGTDTMEQTATYLYERLKNPSIPIVFTGAMKPIGYVDSDGKQNIGEAIFACKLLSPGLYISFHSEVYEVPNVTKYRELGTFSEKKP
jgi:L-asparaginase